MTEPHALDRRWLQEAIELSRLCPPKATAYAVGAVIVDRNGKELARGYSRETDPYVHAEQSALIKVGDTGTDLSGATIYSSLEPCSTRAHESPACTQLILASGIRRVALAMREPPRFANCQGVELLEEAGVEVIEMPELADQVRVINARAMATP